ncbi:GNAT family N-acetyltransferase [Roseateles asaccharophilus]|uniref:Ribosomal protein S18 acetylase RimI-like enzyme n=1 Tax=Roseateles asaccharophilus TaxID=582607 RepID=A0ABU2AEW2_9BURK|nr:GNAT family N-acetyltransferase [Roseateles asaccharophilus]MDR7335732.1 ribosomal protein S18 acetylase RimI-like enzyme [Roseateles asaccharophilus]
MDRRQAVLDQIHAAFDGVQRGDGTSLRESQVIDDHGSHEERQAARALDTDTRWQDVPDDLIAKHYSAFSFVDLAGHVYYAPAYMSWLVRTGYDTPSNSTESAVYAFDPRGRYDGQHQLRAPNEMFTPAQCEAIATYLSYVADVLDGNSCCSDARQYLEDYWWRFLPNATDPFADLPLRAELAGLDASAPPQQADIDGWLIRLSPGKAKRSRCINALRQGTLPLDDLLARCRQAYDAAGLPLAVRVTPWSQPADLDERLAAKGWGAFDAADVMVLNRLLPVPPLVELQALDAARYAATVGALRGSSDTAIAAHAERIANAPVTYQGFVLNDADGALLACGQMVVAGDLVGLYDIASAVQRQGHGQRLCQSLLALAYQHGARQAYLQVGSDNEVAKRLYARMGFSFAYRYHYRSPEQELL